MSIIHRIKRWYKKVTSPFPQFACPRKLESGCGLQGCKVHHLCADLEKNDCYWYERDGAFVCSYCGGIKPSEALRIIKANLAIDLEGTTKQYKLYLHTKGQVFKVYMQHFSREEWDEMIVHAQRRDIINAWRKRMQMKEEGKQ